MTTVMVTGAGSGIGLSILKALAMANRKWSGDCLYSSETDLVDHHYPRYRVIAADCSQLAPGLYAGCAAAVLLPPANGSGYRDALIQTCEQWNVDVLIPGCDPELKIISALKEEIEVTNTLVLVSPWWSVRKTRDKVAMVGWLEENGFLTPKTTTHLGGDAYRGDVQFPLVAKPISGSGSADTFICETQEDLKQLVYGRLYCLQEYLQGDEYTTSVLVNRDGEVYDQMTLRRLSPKIGEGHQMIAREVKDVTPRIASELAKIAHDLQTVGCCNIQWKTSKDDTAPQDRQGYYQRPVPFEINMRFPGSTIICAAAGMNGPDMAVTDLMGGQAVPSPHRHLRCLRHLSEVFLPDDGAPFTLEKLQCASVSPEGLDT